MTSVAPGRVSPYAPARCASLYRGVMAAPGLRCGRADHSKGSAWFDGIHQAELPPLPGGVSPRVVSWT